MSIIFQKDLLGKTSQPESHHKTVAYFNPTETKWTVSLSQFTKPQLTNHSDCSSLPKTCERTERPALPFSAGKSWGWLCSQSLVCVCFPLQMQERCCRHHSEQGPEFTVLDTITLPANAQESHLGQHILPFYFLWATWTTWISDTALFTTAPRRRGKEWEWRWILTWEFQREGWVGRQQEEQIRSRGRETANHTGLATFPPAKKRNRI